MTLSAPALKTSLDCARLLIPPPTARGTKTERESSYHTGHGLPPVTGCSYIQKDDLIRTILIVLIGQLPGDSGISDLLELIPLTTLPPGTPRSQSRQGMILLASIWWTSQSSSGF